jgi:hypothetical protein
MKPELAYANGQMAALVKLAGFPAPTDPTVQNSAVLGENKPKPMSQGAKDNLSAPQNPYDVSQLFSVHEQAKTRMEPRRKLSAESICTSCRKDRHYGTCKSPIAIKRADFNPGMYGGDPRMGNDPSTSPHYHAATTADSSLARARDTQPADVQANTAFADLFRHQGIRNSSDEPGRMYGGLNKQGADFFTDLPGAATHSVYENRGPGLTPNLYEERLQLKSPPLGWADEASQRINRSFDQIDGATDSTCIEDTGKGPETGPAVSV